MREAAGNGFEQDVGTALTMILVSRAVRQRMGCKSSFVSRSGVWWCTTCVVGLGRSRWSRWEGGIPARQAVVHRPENEGAAGGCNERDGSARMLRAMVTSARQLVPDREQERQCLLALAARLDACCRRSGTFTTYGEQTVSAHSSNAHYLAMSYHTHSQWNGSEPSHWYPTEYYQPLNQPYYVQHSYNEPQSGGGSQGTIEQVLPSADSYSRSDAGPGVPANAPTE